MMKRVYSCNVCRDETPKDRLHGIYFTGGKSFDIRDAASTEGVHICFHCMDQLAEKARAAVDRRPDNSTARSNE